MKLTIIVFIIIFCGLVCSDNEIEKQNENLPVDYDRIYVTHRVCARQWGVDYYEFVLENDVEYNETVRCAVECEMKARKLIGKNGKLIIEDIVKEYMKEYASPKSGYTKVMADFVINGCYNEVLKQGSFQECELAFKFYQCQMKKQREWYMKKDLEESLNVWESRNKDTDIANSDEHCNVGSFSSFADILRMIQKNGVEYFGDILRETSFLENQPEVKKQLLNDLKKCYKIYKSDISEEVRACRRDLKFYVCIVSKFEKVLH